MPGKRTLFLFLLVCCFWTRQVLAQLPEKKSGRQISIKKASEAIVIDGNPNEPDWLAAEVSGNFWQQFPFDSSLSLSKTEVMLTYDKQFLYVSAVCYDVLDGPYVAQSLRRDFSDRSNDCFQVMLDPFDDQYNGFSFIVTPYNVQAEGLITGGGVYGQSRDWDNRWFSAVKREPGKWTVEIAIPFKTLRFNPAHTQWGINFSRLDLKRNELSAWSHVPRNFSNTSLAFTGKLIWDSAPAKTGLNLSIIPYLLAEVNRDYTAGTDIDKKFNGGGDAKIAVTSALNLDLTINPDFSQADIDRQITNLTRFNLFFPERRQFFLENSDLFGQFGFSQIRPFFSRQIGLRNGRRIPIQYGMRLSGKVSRKLRIGILNVQTGADSLSGAVPENYTVACFQRQLKGRSNIGAIFVNRQSTDGPGLNANDYSRVLGLDYKLASRNSRWNGIAFFHKSFVPGGIQPEDYTHASFIRYDDPNWSFMWNHEYVGKNYRAEAGFVPRQDQFNAILNKAVKLSYWRLEPEIQHRWYPKNSRINNIQLGTYASWYGDSALRTTEGIINVSTQVNFVNTAFIGLVLSEYHTRLFYPIDVTYTASTPLAAGAYSYRDFAVFGRTDIRRLVTFSATATHGLFYNGTKSSLSSTFAYRIQPWGGIGINYTRDDVQLPAPHASVALNLLGPQLDLSFTRSLFFSSILQYNDQAKNMNIYARLQWRFRPMSDVFIVYSDNYTAPDLIKKNRALVIKLVWWLTA